MLQTAFGASTEISWGESPEWLALLHYKKTMFNAYKSMISLPEFFLNSSGPTDPQREWLATVAVFTEARERKLNSGADPRCRFPARYKFVSKALGWQPFNEPPCQELMIWKDQLHSDSVSLIYASQYSGNPASFFGHTFLKLNNSSHALGQRQIDFLDRTVAYLATVEDDVNPVSYAVQGIFGGFHSSFMFENFQALSMEYSDLENRDLWEYRLNLDASEVQFLLDHLWEIREKDIFTYYFTNRNCAYYVMEALDAIRPSWHLTDTVTLYAAPIDSVKTLVRQGQATVVNYRPAAGTKLRAQLQQLSSLQREAFWTVVRDPQSALPNDAPVLEAIVGLTNYYEIKNHGVLTETQKDLRERSLLARSKLGRQTGFAADLVVTPPPPVHLSHPSSAVELGGGQSATNGSYLSLGGKVGMHELTDLEIGFNKNSEIEILHAQARVYDETRKLTLDHLKILDIQNIKSVDRLDMAPAWVIDWDYLTPKDLNCTPDCRVMHFDSKFGFAFDFSFPATSYFLVGGEVEAGSGLEKGARFGPTSRLGLLWAFTSAAKLHAFFDMTGDLGQDDRPILRRSVQLQQGFSIARDFKLSLHYANFFSADKSFDLMGSYFF